MCHGPLVTINPQDQGCDRHSRTFRRFSGRFEAVALANLAHRPFQGMANMATEGRAQERREMVERQIVGRGVSDPLVLRAMAAVPREVFVPEALAASAYLDGPLPI